MDERFDRVYFLKTKVGEIERVKQLCLDYRINDNGVFEKATAFHFAWAFSSSGLIYISPTTFLTNKIDFNSIKEIEDFLDRFEDKN